MATSGRLFLVFLVMTTSKCSETDEPLCEEYDQESYNLSEGEAFYFVPTELSDGVFPEEDFTWFKRDSDSEIKKISSDEKDRVHYHGDALLFLNLRPEDSGVYFARMKPSSGECSEHPLKINVYKAGPSENKDLLYGRVKNSDRNKKILCPDSVSFTCERLNGKYSWEKDSKPVEGEHEEELWVNDATKDKEGIYTCVCTWTHNHNEYKSSGSRRLEVTGPRVHRSPVILSPTHKEQFADEGSELKLNCSVFCGTNVEQECKAHWIVPGTDGYHLTPSRVNKNSAANNTISTAILTIDKVSAKDFQYEFRCKGVGFYETVEFTVTLKHRESIVPFVICGVCVLSFCVLSAVLVKYFAIDLALFFRAFCPLSSNKQESRLYDAYVVYQMQCADKGTEETLCRFIMNNLPSVLEEKCGYRLFIHGRDDIPGEDRLELIEDRMKQSSRLMVILTPPLKSSSENSDQPPASPKDSLIGGFDWQVGLHHALVQREMSVILIQLGGAGPQTYKHLPAGLQHLIQRSAPIRWPEGPRAATGSNSRFWKRVRYLMPARPAGRRPQAPII